MKFFSSLTFASLLLPTALTCATGSGNLLGNACSGVLASGVLIDNGVTVCHGNAPGSYSWGPFHIPCQVAGYQMILADYQPSYITYVTPHGTYKFVPSAWDGGGPCYLCTDPICEPYDFEYSFEEFGC